MLELINKTSWNVELFPGCNQQGQPQFTCVIKASFSFDLQGQIKPLVKSNPIIVTDEYYDNDPVNRSICLAEESMPFKQGAEVIVYGKAYPFAGDCRMTEVMIALQKQKNRLIQKRLRIFGKRYWQTGLLGAMISKPEPLTPLPICYESAFGGHDFQNPEIIYPYNPVGLGFTKKFRWNNQLALPQIEQGTKYITSIKHHPMPAGFGPIAKDWQPRLNSQMNASDNPSKIDADHYNVAPLDQRFDSKFEGNEQFSCSGLFVDIPVTKEICFYLPVLKIKLNYLYEESIQPFYPTIDTLIVNTEKKVFDLVARAAINWDEEKNASGFIIVNELI